MRPRPVAALAGVAGLVVASAGLFACSGSNPGPPTTAADRAACSELGAAYASFNASPAAPGAAVVYRRAISVASRADDRRLATSITSWVTAMRSPTGTAVAGAPYATQECQRIGIPLRFGTPGAGPNTGPVTGTTSTSGSPTTKPGGGDGSDSESGGND